MMHSLTLSIRVVRPSAFGATREILLRNMNPVVTECRCGSHFKGLASRPTSFEIHPGCVAAAYLPFATGLSVRLFPRLCRNHCPLPSDCCGCRAGPWRCGLGAAFCTGFEGTGTSTGELFDAGKGWPSTTGTRMPMSFWMSRRNSLSSASQKEKADPFAPALPVRPIR